MIKDYLMIKETETYKTKILAGLPDAGQSVPTSQLSRLTKLLNIGFWLALGCCGLVISLKVGSRFGVASVWDDSFMFGRYAGNFLNSGKLSWNPGGPATYGLTSNLFLIVVIPLRFLLGDRPGIVAVLSSMVGGAAFLVLLPYLLLSFERNRVVTKAVILLVFVAFASELNHFEVHITSGMDTTFALTYLTGYIFIWKSQQKTNSKAKTILLGVMGSLAFEVRPDLMLYTLLIPVAVVIFAATPALRRPALAILGITLAGLGLVLVFNTIYFHSTLPLPFYAKSLRIYGDSFQTVYNDTARSELFDFLGAYWFLFALIAVGIICNLKIHWQKIAGLEVGLGVATALFLLYYLIWAIPIMGFVQRFYYPILPALVWLAARSAGSIAGKIVPFLKVWSRNIARRRQLGWIAVGLGELAVILFCGTGVFTYVPTNLNAAIEAHTLGHFKVAENYKTLWYPGIWYRLDQFSALPDDLVMAATEVGYPVAMNPHKTLIDLAGLNETAFAHQQFSADLLFSKYQPDLIYMPHPDYKLMLADLTHNQHFQQDYEYFAPDQIKTMIGVAIRRDSKYYQQMKTIVETP